ncbi:MAG: hypothetical protein C0404_12850 [Verrucomicrobia bacterium]|nr:hypothetical protein [Verrucomicrobiota bacterium]
MRLKDEFNSLVGEHLDGTATRDQTQRLDEIMQRDPKLQQEYRTQLMIHQLLMERFSSPAGADALAAILSEPAPVLTPIQRVKDWFRRIFRKSDCPCCRM